VAQSFLLACGSSYHCWLNIVCRRRRIVTDPNSAEMKLRRLVAAAATKAA